MICKNHSYQLVSVVLLVFVKYIPQICSWFQLMNVHRLLWYLLILFVMHSGMEIAHGFHMCYTYLSPSWVYIIHAINPKHHNNPCWYWPTLSHQWGMYCKYSTSLKVPVLCKEYSIRSSPVILSECTAQDIGSCDDSTVLESSVTNGPRHFHDTHHSALPVGY